MKDQMFGGKVASCRRVLVVSMICWCQYAAIVTLYAMYGGVKRYSLPLEFR